MAFIYVGICLPTNKRYVGSSIRNTKRRPLSHIRDLRHNRHSNSYLQNAWDKYGESNFVWHVVEECQPVDIQAREQWWIGFLRTTDRRYGFNLCNADSDYEEIRSHLSKTQVELWKDPEIKAKRLVGLKVLHKNKEWKSRRAEAMAARWKDPEWKAKMIAVLQKNRKMLDQLELDPTFKANRMRGLTGRV